MFNELRFSLYQCIWTKNQQKHLLGFLGILTVDFDTTFSDRNDLSNLSLSTSRFFDDVHVTYKEIFYANVDMKLSSVSETTINLLSLWSLLLWS